jgi:hypothetical protein
MLISSYSRTGRAYAVSKSSVAFIAWIVKTEAHVIKAESAEENSRR